VIHALVIEDDAAFAQTLQRVLRAEGIDSAWAPNLARAARLLEQERPDLVLLDQGLPDGNGLDFIEVVDAAPWDPVVVMITGVETLSSTVEAIQRGAYDYFVKPPELDELVAVLRRAQRERELRASALQAPAAPEVPEGEAVPLDQLLVGGSPSMRSIFKTIARVAPTPANVLVTGESGTGKELVTRTIHEVSSRREHPFVAVNCASLSASLIESELFGHSRGAFTGATRDRPGRFEMAGEGTLMLDEIGELELDLQAKLLRVLEERTFERVGETRSRPFAARLICATHRDLPAQIEAGRFREDLYFRLRVVEIHLPPLRERPSDIERISNHLLQRVAAQLDKDSLSFSPNALAQLQQHRWPGNVRELRNVIEQAAIMARDVITVDHLVIERSSPGVPSSVIPASPSAPIVTLADMERTHIQRTLDQLDWVKKNVAEALGISRPTLDRKIRLYGLIPSGG